MSAPVTLLLVVGLSGGEVRPAQLRATLDAQLDSRQVTVQVRRADGVRNLELVLETAAANGPVAVVTNPSRGRFEVRVALQPGNWARRTFTFSRRDPLRERNRTVALAIAAMTPEWRRAEPLPEPEPEPETEPAVLPQVGDPGLPDAGTPPLPEVEPAFDAGAPSEPQAAVDAGSPVAEVSLPPPVPAAIVPPASTGAGFELAAAGAVWPLGAGAQLGGFYCGTVFCAGGALRGQRATLGEAQAVIWRVTAQAIARAQLRLGPPWLRGALQVSAGPAWTLAQRSTQAQERWQLEANADLELSVRTFSTVWLFVRGGVGVLSGPTPILVNGIQVSTLPVAWGQGAVGVRIGR